VFVEHALLAARVGTDTGDVDQPLRDPAFARPPGDPCYPPVRGHSNYFADPAFARTADALLRSGTTSPVVRTRSPSPDGVRRLDRPGVERR
jgi:hypothetical protein